MSAGRRHIKHFLMAASLLLLLAWGIRGTSAYLLTNSGHTTNEFSFGQVSCSVQETFDGTTKTDVSITNTGTIPAYIRCALVVTWQDPDGIVCAKAPRSGDDYTLELDLTNGWSQGSDGYYYWAEPVAPGMGTGILISSLTAVESHTPEGYGLHMEILADAVQAAPPEAVCSAWKVSINEGKVSKP